MGKSKNVDAVLRNKGTAIDEGLDGEALGQEASREARIRDAAYAAAERRGFAPGHETQDWLDAERLVDEEDSAQP